jgi:hypothetical protein
MGTQRIPGGAGKTKSCGLKGGSGRPNHSLQKGCGKWYMAVSRSHPWKYNKAQIAIKRLLFQKIQNMGACWAPSAYWAPNNFQAARGSRAPGISGVPRVSLRPKCSRAPRGCWVPKRYRANGFLRPPGVPRSTVGNEPQRVPGPPGVFRDPGPTGRSGPHDLPGP